MGAGDADGAGGVDGREVDRDGGCAASDDGELDARAAVAAAHIGPENRTVAVGFVIGTSDRITPMGSASSTMPASGNSRMTPTVRLSRM